MHGRRHLDRQEQRQNLIYACFDALKKAYGNKITERKPGKTGHRRGFLKVNSKNGKRNKR